MNRITPKPKLTNNGISFSVRVNDVDYPCFISNDTLSQLCWPGGVDTDPMTAFKRFEEDIYEEARQCAYGQARQAAPRFR